MKQLTFMTLVLATTHCTPSPPEARAPEPAPRSAAVVIDWSNEARRAIVPAGPENLFGKENYGNKFPGEAAVYLGIVHTAIWGAARALDASIDASAEAAIATATHHILIGLEPGLGLNESQRALLEARYGEYLARMPEGSAKTNGVDVGARAAADVLALRVNDGREKKTELDDLQPPPAGPGVWEPTGSAPLGLRLPGIRPLALASASQFRPSGPNPLTSTAYAKDFQQVKDLGRSNSTLRTTEQTATARFWTDHDLRQWNDGLHRLAQDRGLDLSQTARLLAMAHIAGADAMIACFDAKYAYWFWRPFQAIRRGDEDGNAATEMDVDWQPLTATPNFPEYPSAHACHSTAVVEALVAFFGTKELHLVLDSRVTGTSREYEDLEQLIQEVCDARVQAGFHFFDADADGSILGRAVARAALARGFPRRDSAH